MGLTGKDRLVLIEVVNQGIDSHLEGFTDSKFNDKYDPNLIVFQVSGPRLFCDIGPGDMPVLLRRLWELYEAEPNDRDEILGETAFSLRTDILGTMEIEEV